MENFGQRLRRLRGARPQKEVADALDIPPTTLSSLESQATIPRGEVLKKLAEFFRVPITYFYDYSEPKVKTTDAAREFLNELRKPVQGPSIVATQANVVLEDDERKKLAELIRKKHAEVSSKLR